MQFFECTKIATWQCCDADNFKIVFDYLFTHYESRTKVHIKNKNYAYDTHK